MRLTTDVLLRMRMLSVPLSESMISEVLSMCLSLGTSIRAFGIQISVLLPLVSLGLLLGNSFIFNPTLNIHPFSGSISIGVRYFCLFQRLAIATSTRWIYGTRRDTVT